MITPEQATELRLFLMSELDKYGFADIVVEVSERLEYENEDETNNTQSDPLFFLFNFLEESIDVLENLSSSNFKKTIDRLNKFCESENGIETIKVEISNLEKKTYFDLRDLPNYNKIIYTFKEILEEVSKQN